MYEDIEENELSEDIRMYVKSYTYLRRNSKFFIRRLMYRLAQAKLGEMGEDDPMLVDRNEHYGLENLQ